MKNKICVIILGPTAVGKTLVSLRLAENFNTNIISADSRQCFKELNIGVAKPSADDLNNIPHYFINSHSIHQEVNAKLFEQYALQAITEIFLNNDIAIMVGGTGLYIKAFCEGLDDIPQINIDIRKQIISGYEKKGLTWLQDELRKYDPNYYAKGEIQNPQRVMRALEVKLSTGKSIVDFRSNQKQNRNFKIIKLGLQLPKEQLHQNINYRVDRMMDEGLLEEVKNLFPFKHLNALQTVGYTELFDYLERKISLNDAIEKIKLNTRHYAKRQMTWFKKDKEVKWINATNTMSVLEEILKSFTI